VEEQKYVLIVCLAPDCIDIRDECLIRLINLHGLVLGLELVPLGITFFCCLFVNMEYGILIGAGVHLFLLAYMAGGRPHPELIRQPVN
jgi:hypothetical protein